MKEDAANMRAYVRYRLEKAHEVYEAALILCNAEQWNSAGQRVYRQDRFSDRHRLRSECPKSQYLP